MIGGAVGDRDPGAAQHPRARRIDQAQHLPGVDRPDDPDRAGRPRRRRSILDPGAARSARSTSGVAPSYTELLFAVSISMIAYTGIETVSNMAEEARDPGEDVPRTVNYVLIAVLGIFAGISIISMSALPVTQDAAGHYSTALGTTYKDDPVLGIVSALHLHGTMRDGGPLLHRSARGDDPDHRHQRGADRDLAPLVVARRAPPAARGLLPASIRRYRTPWFTIAFFSVIAVVLLIPGQDRLPGQPLQLRRDALVHDRPRLDRRAAPAGTPPATGPTARPGTSTSRGKPVPLTAVLGAIGNGRRLRLGGRPPDAVVHDRLLLGDRDRADHPREDRLPGQPLQLRRDALVHDRAHRDRGSAAQGPLA